MKVKLDEGEGELEEGEGKLGEDEAVVEGE